MVSAFCVLFLNFFVECSGVLFTSSIHDSVALIPPEKCVLVPVSDVCIRASYIHDLLIDPVSLVRDHNIKEKLVEQGVSVQSYNGDLLYEPWEIFDESGHAFTTFDPFWNTCLHMQMKTYSPIPPCQLILAQGTTSYKLLQLQLILHEFSANEFAKVLRTRVSVNYVTMY